MTLKRKLLVAFGGLAVLALLAAGVTAYLTARWQGTTEEMRAHYQRSLILQDVRAQTFQALAEVNDALAGAPDDYADARSDFERAIAGTQASFAEWGALAGDLSETVEIREVRTVYDRLTADARKVFDLLDQGRREQAVRLVDDELDTGDYAQFQEVTERAVAADTRIREAVTTASRDLRTTALVMSAVIMIAVLSLALLIAAYLAQDVFRPLAELQKSLEGWGHGERPGPLPVDRADEFGRVAAAFNRAIETRERRSLLASSGDVGDKSRALGAVPPHHVLRAAVARIRSGLAAVRIADAEETEAGFDRLRNDTDALADALLVCFPIDMRLVRLDPRQAAQDALTAIASLLADRGISCECEFEPNESPIMADRSRLREVLAGTLRHALAALPERGGRIGLRVRGDREAGLLHIDVATSGGGPGAVAFGPFDEEEGNDTENADLQMMRSLVSAYGGTYDVARGNDRAAVTRLAFPLSD